MRMKGLKECGESRVRRNYVRRRNGSGVKVFDEQPFSPNRGLLAKCIRGIKSSLNTSSQETWEIERRVTNRESAKL